MFEKLEKIKDMERLLLGRSGSVEERRLLRLCLGGSIDCV